MCSFYTYAKDVNKPFHCVKYSVILHSFSPISYFKFTSPVKLLTNLLFFLNSHYLIPYFLVFDWHSSHFLSSSHVFFSWIIALNSWWLSSISINAWDTKVSMLSSLLLANIRILLCFFFLFLVILSNFLIISVVREKINVKLALAIPSLLQEFL